MVRTSPKSFIWILFLNATVLLFGHTLMQVATVLRDSHYRILNIVISMTDTQLPEPESRKSWISERSRNRPINMEECLNLKHPIWWRPR